MADSIWRLSPVRHSVLYNSDRPGPPVSPASPNSQLRRVTPTWHVRSIQVTSPWAISSTSALRQFNTWAASLRVFGFPAQRTQWYLVARRNPRDSSSRTRRDDTGQLSIRLGIYTRRRMVPLSEVHPRTSASHTPMGLENHPSG